MNTGKFFSSLSCDGRIEIELSIMNRMSILRFTLSRNVTAWL